MRNALTSLKKITLIAKTIVEIRQIKLRGKIENAKDNIKTTKKKNGKLLAAGRVQLLPYPDKLNI